MDPTTFWVNPFGVSFSLIKASDLILVNEEGEVIDGGPVRLLNTAAYMIHSAIHQARPDVNAAAHSHSIYGRSFCSLGRKLDTITQDSCAFHNVCRELLTPCATIDMTNCLQGSRSLRVIQRSRTRGGRGQEHCQSPREQQGGTPPKPRPSHLRRDGRGSSVLVC